MGHSVSIQGTVMSHPKRQNDRPPAYNLTIAEGHAAGLPQSRRFADSSSEGEPGALQRTA